MAPSSVSLTLWMYSGMAPVFLMVSGYTVESPICEIPVNGVALRLHNGKLPTAKSDNVAVGDWLERVSARNAEKHPVSPSAVRSTPSSRNSPAMGLVLPPLSLKLQGTLTGAPLTM